MSVSYGAAGAVTYGTTTLSPSYPSGISANDLILLFVNTKPGTATIGLPSGWLRISESVGTTGTNGVDTGPTKIAIFAKKATGSESGTQALTISSGNSSSAQITRWSSTTGVFSIDTFTGQDTTSGTGYSVAGTVSHGTITSGDMLATFASIPTDSPTWSSHGFSGTGLTIGSSSQIARMSTTTGNDLGGCSWYATVSAGTLSGSTITASATLSASSYGPAVILRIRDTIPTPTGAYAFSEGAGEYAHDTSGAMRDLTLSDYGGDWSTDGNPGGSAEGPSFSGPMSPSIITERTITFRTKLTVSPANGTSYDFIGMGDATNSDSFYVLRNGSGSGFLGHWLETGGTTEYALSFGAGTWGDLTITTGPAGEFIYANGLLVGSNASRTTVVSANDVTIGGGNWKPLNGVIDDVRVYDKVLSIWDINQVNATTVDSYSARTLPAPVSAYGFDDESGTTALDSVGSYHLTSVRSSAWTNSGHTNGGLIGPEENNGTGITTTKQSIGPASLTGRTIMGWIYIEAALADDEGFTFFEREGSDGAGTDDTTYIYRHATDHLTRFGYYRNNLGIETYPEWSYEFEINTWYHIAFVNSPTGVTLFVDGHYVSSRPTSDDVDYNGLVSLEGVGFGADNDTPVRFDDIRAFNLPLRGSEIAQYMATPVAPATPAEVPQIVGVATGGIVGSGTFSVTPPSGAAGYIAILSTGTNSPSASAAPEPTIPSGFTLYQSGSNSYTAWRIYIGGPTVGSSWQTAAGWNTSVLVAGLTAFEVDSYANGGAQNATPTPDQTTPSVTTSYASSVMRILTAAPYPGAASGSYPTAAPNNRHLAQHTNGDEATIVAIATSDQVASGATGTAAFAYTPLDGSTVHTLALRVPLPLPTPIAAYNFDEGSSITSHDYSDGGLYDITVDSTKWGTSGNPSGAILADGFNHQAIGPAILAARTIMFDVRFSALHTTPDDSREILALYGTSTLRETIFLYRNSGGTYSLGSYYENGSTWDAIDYPITVPTLNTWYHLAVTSTDAGAAVYLNGVLLGSSETHVNFIGLNDVTLGQISGSSPSFSGAIDNLRTFDVALTQSQIEYYASIPVAGTTVPTRSITYTDTVWNTGGTSTGDGLTYYKEISITDALPGDIILVFGVAENVMNNEGVRYITDVTAGGVKTESWTYTSGLTPTYYNDTDFYAGHGVVTSGGTITMRIGLRSIGSSHLGVGAYLIPSEMVGSSYGFVGSGFVADTDGLTSVTLAQESLVLYMAGDWSAIDMGSSPTPSGGVTLQRSILDTGAYAVWSASWLNQASGTRNYGPSGLTGHDITGIVFAMNIASTSAPSRWYLSNGTTVTPYLLTGSGLIELE